MLWYFVGSAKVPQEYAATWANHHQNQSDPIIHLYKALLIDRLFGLKPLYTGPKAHPKGNVGPKEDGYYHGRYAPWLIVMVKQESLFPATWFKKIMGGIAMVKSLLPADKNNKMGDLKGVMDQRLKSKSTAAFGSAIDDIFHSRDQLPDNVKLADRP